MLENSNKHIVLVIAIENDYHADAIVHKLTKRDVQVIRIDPTCDVNLPNSINIYSDSNNKAAFYFNSGSRIDFNRVTGIYCRFALETLVPSQSNNALKYFTDSEGLAAFLAPLRSIESSKWINDPWLEARSDCRILQSNLALSLGLNVPDFIVSNSYQELIEFYSNHKDMIIKSISDAPLAQIGDEFVVPEKIGIRKFKAPYTTQFNPASITNESEIDDTPTLLQVKIHKKADIRVTLIDDKVFAALMPYNDGDPIDFRCMTNIKVEPFKLPIAIENKLIQLNNILGVRFSSCDLVLDHYDDYYFLEANLQGNWLWTEQGADLSISDAIASALTN